jgi:hypothetical protein
VNPGFCTTLFYFDRAEGSGPPFRAVAGCTYSLGFPFTEFQQFSSNLYWRADGGFASDCPDAGIV